MYLTRLDLAHFRNYSTLSLDLSAPLTLVQGDNAQGKTNLLEAIYYLATSKSSHARTEREVVGWSAEEEPIPYARIGGTVRQEGRATELEIIFTPRGDGVNYTKQVRINGVPRRSIDLIGTLRAVLFLPQDVVLVSGGPSERRRYLDIALCQIDRTYCQHLSRYQKVVTQRNSLLKQLREDGVPAHDPRVASQLGFWDDQLVRHGTYVLMRRYAFVAQLDTIARERHGELSAGREELRLDYLPSFNPGHLDEADYQRLLAGEPVAGAKLTVPREQVAEAFRCKLGKRRKRELSAGSTLYGPHRDDISFLVDGRELRTYGSRGQQRTGALALKLAEVQAMTVETGESPILLLDDVMSELDAQRRGTLLTALDGVQQAVVTTTDWDDFSPAFRREAQLLQVEVGGIRTVSIQSANGAEG